MEYNKQIAYMEPGDKIEGFYLLKSAVQRISSTGKTYLNAVIQDASGTVDAKMWDYNGFMDGYEGTIVKIRGSIDEYKGARQMVIEKMRPSVQGDTYAISDIVPTAPIDSMKELEFVQEMVSSIEDADYRVVCEKMLDMHVVSFGRIPAAKSIHHSFISGLLMHTANMLRTADYLSTNIYPDFIDRSLLLAGTLLHDFAKEREFEVSELGTVTSVTTEGNLMGHLVMGAEEIGKLCESMDIPEEKALLLKHMILSHHGEPEHGAAVIPCIAEAELLNYIDLIDSRMEIYAETLDKMEPGTFSERVFALDKKIYRHR